MKLNYDARAKTDDKHIHLRLRRHLSSLPGAGCPRKQSHGPSKHSQARKVMGQLIWWAMPNKAARQACLSTFLQCQEAASEARETIQGLRAPAAHKGPRFKSHRSHGSLESPLTQFRGSDTFLRPLETQGRHMVHRLACGQNIYNIK